MSDDANSDDNSKRGSDSIQRQFDWATVMPSTAIVETVGSASDTEVLELGPLYDAIDPDAIDSLCADGAEGHSDTVSISFVFQERGVTVRSDGRVTVYPDGSAVGFE